MQKRTLWIMAVAALALSAGTAHALSGVHGKGDPAKPVSTSTWTDGITQLANRADRVGGYWINASDFFFYEGDTAAFNAFLAAYAKAAPKPLQLILTDSRPFVPFGDTPTPAFDWTMDVTGWGGVTACVKLPLGGRIRLTDVRVPAGVDVSYQRLLDRADPAAERFVNEHKRARPGKPSPEKPERR